MKTSQKNIQLLYIRKLREGNMSKSGCWMFANMFLLANLWPAFENRIILIIYPITNLTGKDVPLLSRIRQGFDGSWFSVAVNPMPCLPSPSHHSFPAMVGCL